jgi:methylornithine synthase
MKDHSDKDRIAALCERALDGETPDRAGLELLLSVGEPSAAEPLFAAARALRARHFGDAVFLYGFVYFSTYCRNECVFCFYRAGNQESPRYRKPVAEVVEICRGLADSGVHLLDLTMGEDPAFFETGRFEALNELVERVRAATDLPIMISPGVVPAAEMRDLRARGADWYACYQETHNRALYERLRVGQSYATRVAARHSAAEAGMLVEDGLLTGIGDTAADRADSVLEMGAADTDQVRVMTFVPQRGTPLSDTSSPDRMRELAAIAAMRLVMPDRLIPASLDVDGIAGLELRLNAGANVVTSLVPPTVGLAGVSQSELDIDEGRRTVAEVTPHLAALGLRPAALSEYRDWMSRRLAAREKKAVER